MSNDTDEPSEPQLLKPREVARRMRVDVRTVRRWAADGRLEAIKLPGGDFRFRVEVIEAALRPHVPTQRTDSPAPSTCQGAA